MALSEDMVASWVVNRVAARVGDSVREFSWDDLRNGNSLPASWWEKEKQFPAWLQDYGVELRIDNLSWLNPNKEVAGCRCQGATPKGDGRARSRSGTPNFGNAGGGRAREEEGRDRGH